MRSFGSLLNLLRLRPLSSLSRPRLRLRERLREWLRALRRLSVLPVLSARFLSLLAPRRPSRDRDLERERWVRRLRLLLRILGLRLRAGRGDRERERRSER